MEFAIIGLIGSGVLSGVLLVLRGFFLPRDFQLSSNWFRILISLSLIANLVALVGFHILANGPAIKGNYSQVLEVLALLSAGAIAGFWGIEYQKAEPDETCFVSIVSVLFVTLFYALFTSICFYAGKSKELQETLYVSWTVPLIMTLILEINVVVDFWDYRKRKGKQARP